MPKRKSFAGRSRSNRVVKKRAMFKRKRKMRIRRSLPMNGFPQSYTARHKLVDIIDLNPGVNSVALEHYRANDVRDPYYAVGGRSAKGYSILIDLYNHYTVIGSKITIEPIKEDLTANTNPSLVWGCGLVADAAQMQSVFDAGPNGYKYVNILESRLPGTQQSKTAGTIYNLNKKSDTMSVHFSAKKFFRKSAIVGDSLYRGNSAAGPTEEAIFTIWAANASNNVLADPVNHQFRVTIEYICIYTEIKPIY